MDFGSDHKTPGHLLESLLAARGWSKRVLAIVLKVDETVINKTISGKRKVDADLALRLGDVFGVPPESFMELQMSFDLAQARLVDRPDPGRAVRASLFGGLPVAEMIKRGWIDAVDARDVDAVQDSLTRFFKAPSLDEIEILPHAAKKTLVDGVEAASPAQLAWLYRVRQIAQEEVTARYSPEAVAAVIPKMSRLLHSPEEARHVPKLLMECGVRFVIVETIGDAKIDGVCFWLDAKKPVIGMSTRFDRMDNFWFVLRHELEHLLRLHGVRASEPAHVMLDADMERDEPGSLVIAEEERQANEAAADFCVPSAKMKSFVTHKAPFFAQRDLIGFARTLHIHPALVAGQLGHITKKMDRFRQHLVKIRYAVAPNAMVDGWGDVYPVEE